MKWRRSLRFLGFGMGIAMGGWLLSPVCQGQVIPDTTLGIESSQVAPPTIINGVLSDRIDGGAQRGSNLFHSFEQFQIPANYGVYFSQPSGVTNIFTRVTGADPSQIFGTLGVLGSANLFLLNPHGIIFGPNARLDLTGSLLVSTADALRFADAPDFSATQPQPVSLLNVTVPIGLGFGSQPAPITIQGTGSTLPFTPQTLLPESPDDIPDAIAAWNSFGNAIQQTPTQSLQLSPGQTLTLAGGDLNLTGANLTVPNGQVVLASVSGSGTWNFGQTNPGLTGGTIQLSQQARVNTSGVGGGQIQVWGDRISLTEQSSLLGVTFGDQPGHGIQIQGNTIQLDQGVVATGTFGTGQSGTLQITGQTLQTNNNSLMSTTTIGAGQGGPLTLNFGGTVTSDRGSLITSATLGPGNGGNLQVDSQNLTLSNGARLSTTLSSSGTGGLLQVHTSGQLSVTGADPSNLSIPSSLSARSLGSGNAQGITVQTQQLHIQDGGQFSTSTFRAGRGGDITVQASESVNIAGVGQERRSGLFAQVGSKGTNQGGNLTIQTPQLRLQDGAWISVATDGTGKGGNLALTVPQSLELIGTDIDGTPSLVRSETLGRGDAGNVTIQAGSLRIQGGAQVSASSLGAGDGGHLSVQAQRIDIVGTSSDGSSHSGLFAASGIEGLPFPATGQGGDLQITTDQLHLQDGGWVLASTLGTGKGGNLQVQANSVVLSGKDAQGSPSLLSVATQGQAAAGNLTLTTNQLDISGGAQVSASTSGKGQGGTVTVTARDRITLQGLDQLSTILDQFFFGKIRRSEDIGSGILAVSFGEGQAGDLFIQTPSLELTKGAFVSTAPFSSGNGGNLQVVARDRILLNSSQLFGDSFGGGNAGNLSIQTQDLTLTQGGAIAASGFKTGRGGTLNINAQDILLQGVTSDNRFKSGLYANAYGENTPSAGNINLQTQTLRIHQGAGIGTGTFGGGQGGNIVIQAGDRIEVTGTAADNRSNIITQSQGSGNAGNLTIDAGQLFLSEDGVISTATADSGDGGNLTIHARDFVELLGRTGTNGTAPTLAPSAALSERFGNPVTSLRADTQGSGRSGNLILTTNRLFMRDGSLIAVRSQGSGQAGELVISANQGELDNRAGLLASTASGEGGNIQLNISDLRLFRGAQISAESQDIGNGGNIQMNLNTLVMLDRSLISAAAKIGDGGNIRINTQGLFISSDSLITASSQVGIDGQVEVRTLNGNVQNSLAALTSQFVNPDQVVADSCLTRRNGQQGSFVVTGASALPNNPYTLQSSSYPVSQVQALSQRAASDSGSTPVVSRPTIATETWKTGDRIQEAQGLWQSADGRLLLGPQPTKTAWLPANAWICDRP